MAEKIVHCQGIVSNDQQSLKYTKWSLTMRMNPLMSRAEDLFSSSRVRALRGRQEVIRKGLTTSQRDQDSQEITTGTQTHTGSHTDSLLDGVVHGLADVHHGVEDDRVSGWLPLVSARDQRSYVMVLP